MRPKNLVEDAAAKCDIKQLEKEIEKVKKKNKKRAFDIADYVRTDVICTLMRNETQSMPKATREDRIMTMLWYLASLGLDFAGPIEKFSDRSRRTPLMQAAPWCHKICELLIGQGADVNAQDREGNTALFYAAGARDPLPTVQLLLDSRIDYTQNLHKVLLNTNDDSVLKMLVDRCIDAESEAQSGKVIHLVVLCLMKGDDKTNKIMDILKEKVAYTVEQQVMLYEFVGFIRIRSFDLEGSETWECWKKAVELRSKHKITAEGLPFDDVAEFDQVVQENDIVKNRCLALYVIGAQHPVQEVASERSNYFIHFWRQLKEALWHIFDAILELVGTLLELCTSKTGLVQVLSIISSIMSTNFFGERDFTSEKVTFELVLPILMELCCKWEKLAPNTSTGSVKRFMYLFVYLWNLSFRTAKSDYEKEIIRKLLQMVFEKNLLDEKRNTLLHYAARGSCTDTSESKLEMVDLILENGANVNARNQLGFSPLQVYLKRVTERYGPPLNEDLVDVFLSNGAHADERLDESRRINEYLRANQLIEFYEMQHVSLKCLAARVIVDRQIPYVGEIPETLETFVQSHKTIPKSWYRSY